jgi:hypothetical protein
MPGASKTILGNVVQYELFEDVSQQQVNRQSTVLLYELCICIPLAAVALLPASRLFCTWVAARGKMQPSRQACLYSLDQYGLMHSLRNGEPVINRNTRLGGALSFAAVLTICVVSALLVIQFLFSNTLVQESLQRASDETIAGLQDHAPAGPTKLANTSYLSDLQGGLQVQMSASGPR